MKKLIVLSLFVITGSLTLESCRDEAAADDFYESSSNKIHSNIMHRCADSACVNHLYPDPPVRDGHDWRSLHNPPKP